MDHNNGQAAQRPRMPHREPSRIELRFNGVANPCRDNLKAKIQDGSHCNITFNGHFGGEHSVLLLSTTTEYTNSHMRKGQPEGLHRSCLNSKPPLTTEYSVLEYSIVCGSRAPRRRVALSRFGALSLAPGGMCRIKGRSYPNARAG